MNLKYVWIVLRKEMKDFLRDKKTVISSIVIPMVLIPALYIMMAGAQDSFQNDVKENLTITLSKSSDTQAARDFITNSLIKQQPTIKLLTVDDPQKALQEGKVRLVIELDHDFKNKLDSQSPFTITLMYDQSSIKSQGSLETIRPLFSEVEKSIIVTRVTALGANPAILEPIKIEEKNMTSEKKGGNSTLVMIIPLLISIFIVSGGIPAATDLVAGEKERNTFEPLLTTRPGRMSILIGKYLTVTLLSFISLGAIIVGMMIGYQINPNAVTFGSAESMKGMSLDPVAVLLAIGTAITLGLMFAGIEIALSTFARTFKEAQTYLGFLIFIVMIPAYATLFLQATDIPMYMYLVPILNAISAFKMVLGGVIDYSRLVLAIGSSLVYVSISLSFAAFMFNREKMLFRG